MFTTKQAADLLGVSRRRVQAMTTTPCPQCDGAGCPRCRQTGSLLPWEPGGKKGIGIVKLIPDWALKLPDIVHRHNGYPLGLAGVTLMRVNSGEYAVIVNGQTIGEVKREKRNHWSNGSEEAYKTRKAAVEALIAV